MSTLAYFMDKLAALKQSKGAPSYVPLVLVVALSCWAARKTALGIGQTDVSIKRPSQTYEDFSICTFIVVLLATIRPQLKSWPSLVVMPFAAAIFAFISNLKPLQASLDNPTPQLKLALGIVAVVLVIALGCLAYSEPSAMLPAAATLVGCLAYVMSLYVATDIDVRKGQPRSETHLHHFQIGIMLALLISCFNNIMATGLSAIGLAIVCHGLSVYRLASPFTLRGV